MPSINKVQAVLAALNEGDEGGLRSRLQYLNTADFPPGLRVGKARRADYAVEEIYAFALWFALSRVSLTPAAAIALISDMWPEWTRLLLTAAHDAGMPGLPRPTAPGATVAVLLGNAVRVPSPVARDMRASARGTDISSAAADGPLASAMSGAATAVVVDVRALLDLVAAALARDPAPMPADALSASLIDLSRRESPDDRPTEDGRHVLPRHRPAAYTARGERLGEADYFFSRALEVMAAIPDSDDAQRLEPSSRLRRLVDYLLRPNRREGWKRWLEVRDTGVPFLFGIAALVEDATCIASGLPQTILVSARGRIAADTGSTAELKRALADAAVTGRGLELDEGSVEA